MVNHLITKSSTRRCPTKPVPPVTTHTAGTGGNSRSVAAVCSGDARGATSFGIVCVTEAAGVTPDMYVKAVNPKKWCNTWHGTTAWCSQPTRHLIVSQVVWRLECTPRVPNACSHSADGGHRLVGGDGKPGTTAVRSKPHQRAEPVWQGGHALPHLQDRHDGVVLSRMRCRRHLRRMVRQAHTPTDTPHHDTSPVNRCSGGGVQSVLARRGGTALGG
jgi:hypothetical protein